MLFLAALRRNSQLTLLQDNIKIPVNKIYPFQSLIKPSPALNNTQSVFPLAIVNPLLVSVLVMI